MLGRSARQPGGCDRTCGTFGPWRGIGEALCLVTVLGLRLHCRGWSSTKHAKCRGEVELGKRSASRAGMGMADGGCDNVSHTHAQLHSVVCKGQGVEKRHDTIVWRLVLRDASRPPSLIACDESVSTLQPRLQLAALASSKYGICCIFEELRHVDLFSAHRSVGLNHIQLLEQSRWHGLMQVLR